MITDSVKVPGSEVTAFKYKIEDGIAVWMDCGGSNALKINEQFIEATGHGIVKMIITTRSFDQGSRAKEKTSMITKANSVIGMPLVEHYFINEEENRGIFKGDYYKALSGRKTKSSLPVEEIIEVRRQLGLELMEKIETSMDEYGLPHNMPMFAAGGMAILPAEFVERFDILNVHPGDVTKYDLNGVKRGDRAIIGDGWIPPAKAISAGHDALYSSMHQMIPELDAGPNFMRGYALPMDYNYLLAHVDINNRKVLKAVAEEAQEVLKDIGDHVIAGATFLDMFNSNWGMHEKTGHLAYRFRGEWYMAPNGITAEDHARNNPGTPFKRDQTFLDEKITAFYDKVAEIGGK